MAGVGLGPLSEFLAAGAQGADLLLGKTLDAILVPAAAAGRPWKAYPFGVKKAALLSSAAFASHYLAVVIYTPRG